MAADAVTAEIEDLKKKLSQNPDSLVFVPLADAYRKAGMLEEAIEVIKKGLEKHQSYASARVVLGRIYSEKNMLDEAIDEFKKVEAADSNNIMVHSMLGNVYLKKKYYAQAIEQYQRVLSLNPEDTETQEKLQEALSAKQEPAPAKAEAKPAPAPPAKTAPAAPAAKPAEPPAAKPAAAAQPPKVDIQKNMKVAELYTKKEDFGKAIEVYRELLESDPENLILQQRLREVYDLQDKKQNKQREKVTAGKDKLIEAEKITTEDILDVMKEAVEDERIEEEKAAPAPAAKPAPAPAGPAPKPAEPAKPALTPVKPAEPAKPAVTAAAAGPISGDKAKEIEKIIKGLADVEGMVACFFLQKDGTIVASVMAAKTADAEIGKAIAQIVNKTEQSVRNMKQGVLKQVAITSEEGVLMFTELASGVIFMVGNEKINVGKMSLVLKEVIANIKKVTG